MINYIICIIIFTLYMGNVFHAGIYTSCLFLCTEYKSTELIQVHVITNIAGLQTKWGSILKRGSLMFLHNLTNPKLKTNISNMPHRLTKVTIESPSPIGGNLT